MRTRWFVLLSVVGVTGLEPPEGNYRPAKDPGELAMEVLVARREVPAWVLLKQPEQYFVRSYLPLPSIPPDAICSFAELRGERLNLKLAPGEFVRKADLLNSEYLGGHPRSPSPRAVTVRIQSNDFDNHKVKPGMRVDVYVTKCPEKKVLTPRLIMSNRLVVAVTPMPGADVTKPGPTITLGVMPEEANRLYLAESFAATLEVRPPAKPAK